MHLFDGENASVYLFIRSSGKAFFAADSLLPPKWTLLFIGRSSSYEAERELFSPNRYNYECGPHASTEPSAFCALSSICFKGVFSFRFFQVGIKEKKQDLGYKKVPYLFTF
jgi:hypothetical protein